MNLELRLDLASRLLDVGAAASALEVLGTLRGAAANRLRARAPLATLRPGVYALTALRDVEAVGAGVALPLQAELGEARFDDDDARRACACANEALRRVLGLGDEAPALRVEGDLRAPVAGPSIALGAALAFARHLIVARGGALQRAVLATGALSEDGAVQPVGFLAEKCAVAARESGARVLVVPADARAEVPACDGLELRFVRTLDEALACIFGPGPYELDARVLRFEERFVRACEERDPAKGEAMLRALGAREGLAAVDRARVSLELGTRLRHLGRTSEARALHGAVRAAVDDPAVRGLVGAESAERYELECVATAMDDFALDASIATLTSRLARPFLLTRNELRCRGMLAQALGMRGDFSAAARVREENLALHERSESLRSVLPGTLCWLALDAARAGDLRALDRWLARLALARRPGDLAQARYDGACVLRALVCAGRDDEALAWARGASASSAGAVPEGLRRMLAGDESVTGYPEVSAVRAAMRAHWRTGDIERALRLGSRVRADGGPLVAWVATLARLEGSIAWALAARDEARAVRERDEARAKLAETHEAASAFHQDLFTQNAWSALALALDRVWY